MSCLDDGIGSRIVDATLSKAVSGLLDSRLQSAGLMSGCRLVRAARGRLGGLANLPLGGGG